MPSKTYQRKSNKNRHKSRSAGDYMPDLKDANYIKKDPEDWWDKICIKYGETNYWIKVR